LELPPRAKGPGRDVNDDDVDEEEEEDAVLRGLSPCSLPMLRLGTEEEEERKRGDASLVIITVLVVLQ